MMTPHDRKQASLRAEARAKTRAAHMTLTLLAVVSILIIVHSDNPLLNLALIGLLWFLGFCFVYVELHLHALIEVWLIRRKFYQDLEAGHNMSPVARDNLTAADAAEFEDLVQRFHDSGFQ